MATRKKFLDHIDRYRQEQHCRDYMQSAENAILSRTLMEIEFATKLALQPKLLEGPKG